MYKDERVKHFARLNKYFIQRYERYLPTAFDESMTLLEKVNKVIEGLNTIVRHINNQSETLEEWQSDLLSDLDATLDDYVNELTTLKQTYETFRQQILDDILPESTLNILTGWFNDGTLEQIINENIFNDINMQLAQRPTQTEMNDKFSQIVSSTPKGVYPTLDDLKTALPVGDTGIYLVSSDGNWYYWNTLIDNLFDKETVTIGEYLIDGVPTEGQTSSAYSDYISVSPGETYWITRILETDGGAFYDQNKNYLGKIVGDGSNTLIIPSNVYFIRLNITPEYYPLSSFVVKQGNNNTGEWQSGGVYQGVEVANKAINSSKIETSLFERIYTLDKNKKIRPELLFDTPQINLFNKHTVTMGYFLIAGVPTISSAHNSYSDYIPIIPSSLVTATRILESDGGAFYDQNLNYIDNFQGENNQINTPENAYYIRLNVNTGASAYNLDNFMVVEGESLPSTYHEHGVGKIKGLQVDTENVKKMYGKSILTIGDSITWLDGTKEPSRNYGETVIGYQEQFRKEGANVTILGNSGATIAQYDETDNDTHPSIYDDVVTDEFDVTDYDVITLLAGTNDVYYKNNFGEVGSSDTTKTTGALKGILEYIFNHNPTAKIYIFAPFYSSTQTRTREKMLEINQLIGEVAKFYNVPCVEMYSLFNVNELNYTSYFYDTTHPNNTGMEWLGQFMIHNIVS